MTAVKWLNDEAPAANNAAIAANDASNPPMPRTPEISFEDCIGCGACVDVCPEVFSLNEAIDKALVINPQGCPEERIQEAVDLCPVHCIFWEE